MASSSYPNATAAPLGASSSYASPPPQRRPVKLHWANWMVAIGIGAMVFALFAVAVGLPGKIGYNETAPGKKVQYDGWDPQKINASIDSNMKYIREATGFKEGQYNHSLQSVDDSETVLPEMGERALEMDKSVQAIDMGLAKVLSATEKMNADMVVMAASSSNSAETMGKVAADLRILSSTMSQLYGESQALDAAMRRIERKAAAIAADRTGPAREETRKLSSVLPEDVPAPVTSLDPETAR